MVTTEYVAYDLLGRLIGFRLLAAEFVLDYLQFRFDREAGDPQPMLVCDTWPSVRTPGGSHLRDGDTGYADAIRELVGQVVVDTDERSRRGIRVHLESSAIVLDPSRLEMTTPEIAMLSGFGDGRWMCWRPGEQSFERPGH